MSPLRPKHWMIALSAVIGVALMVPLAQRILRRHLVRYSYATGSIDPATYTKLASRPAWQASTLEVAPGIELKGLIRRPAASDAPWIFFLTGNDQTPLATAQRFIEDVRGDHDWGATVYAYRGYDSSTGSPHRDEIASDMLTVYRHIVEQEHVAAKQIHVAAFSLGAYFATYVVGQVPAAQKPASLSLLAPAANIVMVRKSWAAVVMPGDLIDTKPLLSSVPAPVLVLQGADDQTTGVAQGKAVAEVLGTRARYQEFASIGHTDMLETPAPASAVRAMIEAQSQR